MTTLDQGIAALRTSLLSLRGLFARPLELYERASLALKSVMPKGLFARALLIIIVPMVVLQSVVAFMDGKPFRMDTGYTDWEDWITKVSDEPDA